MVRVACAQPRCAVLEGVFRGVRLREIARVTLTLILHWVLSRIAEHWTHSSSRRSCGVRMSCSLRHAWAIKSAAWKVHNAFGRYPVREETLSNALKAELEALLPTSIVTREVTVRLTFVPTGCDAGISCGHGRVDVLVQTTPSDCESRPVTTVIEVKRDTAKTGLAQARMYRDFLGATDAFLIVFAHRGPLIVPVPARV